MSKTRQLLPPWADEMREVFRSGTVSQFLLHGNVRDLVRLPGGTYGSLREFLVEMLFGSFDLVVYYSSGAGLKAIKGQEHLSAYLKLMAEWGGPASVSGLPREPGQAFDLIDGLLRYSLKRTVAESKSTASSPLKMAAIVDFVQYLVPGSPTTQSQNLLVRLLDWSSDATLLRGHLATVLLTDNLRGLARDLVENPYSAKISIPMPGRLDCLDYLESLKKEFPELETQSDVTLPNLATRSVGLTLVNMGHTVALALRNQRRIDTDYLSRCRKELIEKECYGLLEFVESRQSLDDVAGHDAVKEWLREDTRLLKQGETDCLPMGYLISGRIGTGKTWLARCWAGEVGIPFVIFRNFRDKWAGATESNLETIFEVLGALGQVIVFVDEADQMAGSRGGGNTDGGLSGRVYAMLAQAMSETRNRGKILWVFATSRPDLLEVDLKRPGRLDVHIPLFAPQTKQEQGALMEAMAQKVGLSLLAEDLPDLGENFDLSGNEIEALMVRARRRQALSGTDLKQVLADLVQDFRPSAHRSHLEYMDLLAVKECTDERFLPPKFKDLTEAQVESRLALLHHELGH